MNRILPLMALVLSFGTTPHVFAQSDAGATPVLDAATASSEASSTESDSVTGQVHACTVSCIRQVMSGGTLLDHCVGEIPECAGLEAEAPAIRAGICDQAHDVVRQCDPPVSAYSTSVVDASSEATPRHRPRRLELVCQDGSVEGRGWRSHCVCPEGRVGVDESRYVLTRSRRRQRYSRTSATVLRVVYCVPSDPVSVATAHHDVGNELDRRVSELESDVDDLDRRVTALEERPVASPDGAGLSEDRVREIVSEATEGFVTQPQLQEIVEMLGDTHRVHERMLERQYIRIRCLEGDRGWHETRNADGSVQRIRCRERPRNDSSGSNGTQGSFGFRLSSLLSIGFQPISFRNQMSSVPVYLAGELGITVSVADRWYLEGAVGFGYAFEDAAVGDGFQGQYRIGAMRLLDLANFPMGVAFGGILTERYDGGFQSGTFTSDHTLAGGYLELLFNTPTHGTSFYGFVRVMGGAGLRFENPQDHVTFDGGIQFGIGIARFGDD